VQGPSPTKGDNWQQELVLDVVAQAPQQENTCGLLVLQYHLILGFVIDKRLDLLSGLQDVLLGCLVIEVIPTPRSVSRDTTERYYHKVREGVETGRLHA
jgi:hypothetical protein